MTESRMTVKDPTRRWENQIAFVVRSIDGLGGMDILLLLLLLL